MGWTLFDEWPFCWSEDRAVLEKALQFSKKAVDLDPNLPDAFLLMACTYVWIREYEKMEPDFKSEAFGHRLPIKDPAIQNRFIEMLKKAGFP